MSTIPGITTRITSAGIPVMRFHYSSDPMRRPGTLVGDRWLKEASLGYPGGTISPRWRKEQEIDYTAMSGTKLFPLWEDWKQNGKIVIPFFEPHGYKLFATYDHGWINPACYLIHGVDCDGNIVTFWEFYAKEVPAHAIADIILGKDVRLLGGRSFSGNPFAGKEAFKIADPQIWAEDQPQLDGPNKATADLFRKCGVHFQKGERGADLTVAEWLTGHFWRDPLAPKYRICNTCPKLIWELGQQRFKDFSAQVLQNKDPSEQLIDKDNHAWDSLKMGLKRFPPPNQKPKPKQPINSFQWWRTQNKRAHDGLPVGTFTIQRET